MCQPKKYVRKMGLFRSASLSSKHCISENCNQLYNNYFIRLFMYVILCKYINLWRTINHQKTICIIACHFFFVLFSMQRLQQRKFVNVNGYLLKVNKCQRWFRKFANDDFDLSDDDQSGRPADFDNYALKSLVETIPRLSI